MLQTPANRLVIATALCSLITAIGDTANAQIITFQEGVSGYASTVDTEFRDTDPTNGLNPNRGTAIEISVDQADSDIPGQPGRTQGAIRFENILGVGPGLLDPSSEVLFADVVVFATSATSADAVITFDRVLGADQGTSCSEIMDPSICDPFEPTERGRTPGLWREDDSWFSLGGSVIGVPNPLDPNLGVLPFDPIETGNSDVLAVGAEAVRSSEDENNPFDGRLLEQFNTVSGDYVSIEVTDSIRKYQSGEVNAGWAINSTSGNGWDFVSSDFTFAGAIAAGEEGFVQALTDAGLTELDVRPELRIVVGVAGDIDLDGDIDTDDFDILVGNLGNRNGSRDRGLNGDLNFDYEIDLNDFADFRTAFINANGEQAFTDMITGVPEPGTALLVALALTAIGSARRAS